MRDESNCHNNVPGLNLLYIRLKGLYIRLKGPFALNDSNVFFFSVVMCNPSLTTCLHFQNCVSLSPVVTGISHFMGVFLNFETLVF